MKGSILIAAVLTFARFATGDFSYQVTTKTGGAMAAMAGSGPQAATYYFKGQKMKHDRGNTAIIMDFDAQTVTTIDNARKSYTVKSFSEVTAPAKLDNLDAKADVRETGQKRAVNGFNASEFFLTMEFETAVAGRKMRMQMEADIWASPDVPGGGQVREFYQRNADRFPWNAMAGGTNTSLQKSMVELQRKMAGIAGVTVQEIVKMKAPAGAAGGPQMSAAQTDQMAQARAKLEAMVAQGGPQAAMLKQQLDRMPGGAGSSGAMIEITMDSSNFSSAPIPESVFAVPSEYQKSN